MTLEEMREKAIQLMMKRFHRSQAVLAVGQEKLGRKINRMPQDRGGYGPHDRRTARTRVLNTLKRYN